MNYLFAIFYSGFGGFVILIFIPLFPSILHLTQYDTLDILFLLLTSSSDLLGVIFNTLAYKHAEVSKIAPILYLMIVICFLVDTLIMDYSFTPLELSGCLLITVCVTTPSLLLMKKAFNF